MLLNKLDELVASILGRDRLPHHLLANIQVNLAWKKKNGKSVYLLYQYKNACFAPSSPPPCQHTQVNLALKKKLVFGLLALLVPKRLLYALLTTSVPTHTGQSC
jgi:hypothetical protein